MTKIESLQKYLFENDYKYETLSLNGKEFIVVSDESLSRINYCWKPWTEPIFGNPTINCNSNN